MLVTRFSFLATSLPLCVFVSYWFETLSAFIGIHPWFQSCSVFP